MRQSREFGEKMKGRGREGWGEITERKKRN